MPDTIHKAYKTQLRTTPAQRQTFRQWAGCARYVYNWALDLRKTLWQEESESISAYDLDKRVTQLKKEEDHEWLKDPPRRVLYYAVQDLDAAFQGFFRRVKNGETPGYPRFKAKGRSTPSFSVYGSDIRVEEARVRLPKLGWVKLEEKAYIPSALSESESYGRVTVSRDGDTWSIAVACEVRRSRLEIESRAFGKPVETAIVHPGVRSWITLAEDFASMSQETEMSLPAERLAQLRARLDRQQRKLARKEEGSRNRERMKKRLARTYRKIRNLRSDCTHKASAYICYVLAPDRIVLQDWDVRSMLTQVMDEVPREVRARIRRHVANANFGELLRQIRYKAEWAGIDLIEVEQGVPVSKRCAQCLEINDDFGAEKIFECPSCGHVQDREANAVANLRHELATSTREDAELEPA